MFLYVFTPEDRDKLLSRGFKEIRTAGNDKWCFDLIAVMQNDTLLYSGDRLDDLLGQYTISDTLWL